jgi:pimeloyl-ACP methyl ester carboxylesterase
LERADSSGHRGTVLLVHGLWLHPFVMGLMRSRLARHGYDVLAYGYPTVTMGLRENVERLRRYCDRFSGRKLHLVGHSMGGLVALKAAELVPRDCLGRVVLVGTPFGDSFAAHALQRLPGGTWLLGRCMPEWLAAARVEPFAACELGVIAGSRGVGLGRVIAPGLPRPHDGVVSVEETRVPGMTDHIVLRVAHTEMLFSRPVARQIAAFLGHGKFDRTQPRFSSVN